VAFEGIERAPVGGSGGRRYATGIAVPGADMNDDEAAALVIKGMDGAIASKRVTYDFARLMDGRARSSASEFGDNLSRTCREGV
jgi:hypothetical protein